MDEHHDPGPIFVPPRRRSTLESIQWELALLRRYERTPEGQPEGTDEGEDSQCP